MSLFYIQSIVHIRFCHLRQISGIVKKILTVLDI